MEKVEKEVYTNKELRDTLESYNLNDDTIDLIEIKLYIKKWNDYKNKFPVISKKSQFDFKTKNN